MKKRRQLPPNEEIELSINVMLYICSVMTG